MIECHGDHFVSDDTGWVCTEYADEHVCRRHSTYPDDGSDGIWDCYYEGEFRVCVFRGGGSGDECPPSVEVPTDEVCGDSVDNDCDGRIDETCVRDVADCVCIPSSWRYCDTPDYCLWGTQVCDEDGMAWGPCIETDVPERCAAIATWYSAAAEACCIESGQCCQDRWDLDGDGDTWESLPYGCPAIDCT